MNKKDLRKKYKELRQLLSEEALEEICSEISFKKNTDVQPIGHTCRTIYFIKKGIAALGTN